MPDIFLSVQQWVREEIQRQLRRAGITGTIITGGNISGPIGSGSLPSHNHTSATGQGGTLTGSIVDTYVEFEDTTTPSTPASGKVRIFADDDQIKAIDDGGDVVSLSGSGGSGAATIYTSVYASPPGTPAAGDLWLPSDGFTQLRYSGSAWVPWGPVYPFIMPPAVGGFSWDNQGTSTIANEKGGIWFAPQPADFRTFYKAAPSTPWTFTAAILPTFRTSVGQSHFGIGFRQSSDGKLHILYVQLSADGWALHSGKWTSPTVFSAGYVGGASGFVIPPPGLFWLRIADNGTNRIVSFSGDGQHWATVHSVSRTDFLTADQICVEASLTNAGEGIQIVHWAEA